jgi:hypothetical protein
MTRYTAHHVADSASIPGIDAGDTLAEAKAAALAAFGDGFQEGEIQILDTHTVGMIAASTYDMRRGKWKDDPRAKWTDR